MAIPKEFKDRLEHRDSRTVQQADIVRVMEDNRVDKPWSRYMIQQHLDTDTTRATVNSRLQELVELDVLDTYEYRGKMQLYDLAYDPIVTDGGRLNRASFRELATFQDRESINQLAYAGFYYSLGFLVLGAAFETLWSIPAPVQSDALFVSLGMTLLISALLLLLVMGTVEATKPWVSKLLATVHTPE